MPSATSKGDLYFSGVHKMHQNLLCAVGYNVLAFPLAAGALYPLHLVAGNYRAVDVGQSAA
jgi:cation transport ATPase